MKKLKELLLALEPSIKEMTSIEGNPSEVYEPISYILGLGGKRIRPAMVLATYKLFREDINSDVLTLAMAVEMFHNFTLMHDDIMDKADLRRGKQTVHIKWDEATAILSGDLLQIKVYETLASLGNIEIINLFNSMAIELCEGQMSDMMFEQKENIANNDYLNMIRQKTAVLLGFSLQASALLAGASNQICKDLYDLGISLGLSFQLMDDYLDSFGEKAKVGKRIGGDILEKKKTYLWNEMWHKLDLNEQQIITDAYNLSDEECISIVKQNMSKTGAADATLDLANKYTNQSKKLLSELNVSGNKAYLEELTAMLANRES